ncbi:MAG: Uma2 family endonuclease [Myxococcota bacterium]
MRMSSVQKREDVSYADIEALPPNVVGEIVAGELIVSPRPAGPHARAASSLGMVLGPPYDFGHGGPGGWLVLDEPELHLPPDVLVPDVAAWRRERMARVPDDHRFTIAPDWVGEVLSPSTARFDRTRKMESYARERVKHLWLIDPREKTLEVLRLDAGRWTVVKNYGDAEGHTLIRAEPFDAVAMDLRLLWT